MSGAVFLTGGTGFLGMELLARLVEADHGPDVFVAVRAADRDAAAGRLDDALAELYDVPPPGAARLRAVRADLTTPGLGLDRSDRDEILREVSRVVHCAASISWDLPLDQARTINVEGTRMVAGLAQQLDRLERFVHVSTAYVAGRTRGTFAETDLDLGQTFRNTYEQTKWEAELMLAGIPGLPLVVVRPSIVVGESDSGWTPAFNVVYWPMQAFARGLLPQVPADPAGVVDIVPVDYVADLILRAAFGGQMTGTLHAVAGDRALSVVEVIEQSCRILERRPPALTPPGSLDPNHPAAMFAPYFDVETRFDDRRTRGELAPGLTAPPTSDYLPEMLAYAIRARWGRAPLTRAAARRYVSVRA